MRNLDTPGTLLRPGQATARNLDSYVDPSDLDELATLYRERQQQGHPGSWDLLARYARFKANAMRHRMAGNVVSAMHFEEWCDRVYEVLPPNLQW